MKSRSQDKTAFARWIRPLVAGCVAGALVCFLLLLLMAAVLVAKDIPKTAATPMALCAAAAGALAGGVLCGAMARQRGWLCGAAVGALLFLLVLLAGWMLVQPLRFSALLLKAALLVAAGSAGGVLGVNLRRR